MGWSGGTFTRVDGATGWQDDATAGVAIEASLHDAAFNDLATDGINQCIHKGGSNTPTANLPMGGYKHTNVANGSASSDYMAFGQISNGTTTVDVGSVTCTSLTASATGTFLVNANKFSNDTDPPVVRFQKSRATVVGTNTIVQDGDAVGRVDFNGANGTAYNSCARIVAEIDGTPGATTDMPGRLIFATTTDGLGTPAERMRINNAGKVAINSTTMNLAQLLATTTSNTFSAFMAQSNVAGDVAQAALQVRKTDNNSTTSQVFVRFTINDGAAGSGQINANGANQAAFGSTSDQRLKENIQDLPSQFEALLALRPVEFDYIDGSGHQIGFIAQEVQEVYPDVVGVNSEGYLTLSGLGRNEARLVKGFQEMAQKIAELEFRLAALEE